MEEIQPNPYLRYSPNAKHNILKIYDLHREDRLTEAVNILDDWVKKQAHFVKRDFPRHYLEAAIVSCKGSIEKAKKQLDNLCTMKTVAPFFFTKTNVKKELKNLTLATGLMLPNTTDDDYRIALIRMNKKEIQTAHFLEYYQYCIIVCKYLKCHDYINGCIMVIDFRNANILELMSKLNGVELQQCITTVVGGYGARLKNILFITESKAIELFVKLVKPFVSQKIASRIEVLNSIEELTKYVPERTLPEDYGGTDRHSDILYREWVDALSSEEHVSFMKMINMACTDESRREIKKSNQEYQGISGSFRHLTVD